MATGIVVHTSEEVAINDANFTSDAAAELMGYIPPSWTSLQAKRQGGNFWLLMNAIGQVLGNLKHIVQMAKLQLRFATATGDTLDTMSVDYLGNTDPIRLPRLYGEGDDSFRRRLLAEITREKATLQGITKAVNALTGGSTMVFEPFNVLITAAWGDGFSNIFNPTSYRMFALGGAYGNDSLDQFIAVARPDGTVPGTAAPNVGIGAAGESLNTKFTFYVNILTNPNNVSNTTIQLLVNRIKPVGTVGIVQGGN